jgi:malonyl-CoA O-methyltransferase
MRDQFAQAAASYDEAAVLAREVGCRMAERLDYVKIAPACMADIGCATGDGIRELQRRYPQALALAIDFALPMLAEVQTRSGRVERWRGKSPCPVNADVRKVPLTSNSLGLVWSNLMLHWLDDPLPALRELHRVTETAGLITFSMLGPDTLKEVRHACLDLGIPAPLRRFHDMHDIGDMLIAAGFADPVMDMEMITMTYASPRGLLRDQRQLGVRDRLFGRLPWRDWRRVFRHYAAQHIDGRLSATFEVIYGHAWKPEPRQSGDDHAIIRFQPRQT